ncbi:MAG: ATPase [Actinomycetota bacterium]|nr:ATPase [Actinomycetota bacterium]
MPSRESFEPVRMRRVAILAPAESLRDVLVEVAARGTAEIETAPEADAGPAARMLVALPHDEGTDAGLVRTCPDVEALAEAGRADLITGESQLEVRAAAAVSRGEVCGVLGWTPAAEVEPLAGILAPHGGAVVALPTPRGVDTPSLVHSKGRLNKSFAPLVDTYATVPYEDVDPTVLAGLAFAVMFGMMFADAGQGTLLLIAGVLLAANRIPKLSAIRRIWPFVVGSAAMAIFFGVLFGQFFGPTGVLPVLWFDPLEDPTLLLGIAVGIGACMLAVAYVIGTINRWREGGWRLALVSSSGVAGIVVFLALGLLGLGVYSGSSSLVTAGVAVGIGGLVLSYIGLFAASSGGGAGAAEAGVELFDGVIRLGTNLISFARLAAFGLAHAALLAMVWDGTTALWAMGGLAVLAAIAVFLLGNAVTFVLEGVVSGVQAMRLEYYELFSKIFVSEGRAFRPWFVPTTEERVP